MLNPRTKNALYVLIFTAIAVLGAYFLITEINKMSEDSDESILSDFWQKKRPNQVEVADTKNWKTYRNEEYGFEFKYPKDFTIIKEGNSLSIESIESMKCRDEATECTSEVQVYIHNNPKKLLAKEYYNSDKWKLFDNPNEDKEIIIDGKTAFKAYPITGIAASVNVIIPIDENFILFETFREEEVLNQILSTFKFISKKTTFTIDEIANKSLKVGDVLGDFTVTSVGVFFKDREQSINEDNYEVTFSGVSIIEAEYEYQPIDPGPGPTLWLIADDNSDIPGLNGTKKIFTLNNYSDVEKYFGETPSRGRVTLKIRDYYAVGCGCEKSDEAKLVELISKQVY